MRCIKTLGLAALAATALIALVASSASAARVCSTSGIGETCNASHGKVYTGTIIAKNSGNVVVTATNPDNTTFTVTASEIHGDITNGSTGVGRIDRLTATGGSSAFCFGTLTGSTTASTTSPWSMTVSTTIEGVENTNGIMTIASGGLKFTCGFPAVECVYSFSNAKLHIDGSDTVGAARLTVNVLLTKTSGPEFTCGTSADWTGTYNITTPTTLMIE
jgi:hypothetical protein